jgi:hypothetical protein
MSLKPLALCCTRAKKASLEWPLLTFARCSNVRNNTRTNRRALYVTPLAWHKMDRTYRPGVNLDLRRKIRQIVTIQFRVIWPMADFNTSV